MIVLTGELPNIVTVGAPVFQTYHPNIIAKLFSFFENKGFKLDRGENLDFADDVILTWTNFEPNFIGDNQH